jgi:low affinity Fe/Cu permease
MRANLPIGSTSPTAQSNGNWFARLAVATSRISGRPATFLLAVAVVVVWAVTGPLFGFSDTWQLVINTGTTIITFVMVFLIQRTQNKDSLAVQLKLDELVAAIDGASNRLISVEDLSEEELKVLRIHFQRLADMASRDEDLLHSHSIEEAEARHALKRDRRRKPAQKIVDKLRSNRSD